jgi:DNA-binding CsgD family transcriptional regulator
MLLSEQFALDHVGTLPLGFVALDENGTVLKVNEKARTLLQANGAISIKQGRLAFGKSSDRALFDSHFRTACTESAQCSMPVTRDHGPTYCLLIAGASQFKGDDPALAVVVLISDPAPRLSPSTGRLRRFFGFTPAEARLAVLLVRGATLTEAAVMMRTTVHTTRAHLKSIFRKTSTNRQGELIYILLSSPASMQLSQQKQERASG